MYDRIDAAKLNDLLIPMSLRPKRGVYFVRVCGWTDRLGEELWAVHEAAQRRGVVLEGQIANPDNRQMSYLNDVLGTDFEPGEDFVVRALERWMPRMSPSCRRQFAQALCVQFDELRRAGKTDSILRNIYFKIMCWLYYRFERLMPLLDGGEPPTVLLECAGMTAHELMLLRLLNRMGADIALLELSGDGAYLKQDPASAFSQLLLPEGRPFPEGFCLKQLRGEMTRREREGAQRPGATPSNAASKQATRLAAQPQGVRQASQTSSQRIPAAQPHRPTPAAQPQRPIPAAQPRQPMPGGPRQTGAIDPLSYFKPPRQRPCTNAWMKEAAYTQILTPIVSRGEDSGLFYNAFIRVRGVTDKVTYLNELHRFYQDFTATGRRLVIVDDGLALPQPQEIERIRRRSYRSAEEMIVDLAGNLPGSASLELQKLMQRAFVSTMRDAQRAEPVLNRLLNSAVYLLCWILRYQGELFQGYRDGDMPCFILMGGCAGAGEALYPIYLSRLPVDVLILAPDLNRPCALSDPGLLELTGADSLPTMKFPRDAGTLQVGTLAAHAEDDLARLLYTDSGIYRNRQISRADSLTLRTTYDELFILWNQELKYRPGFDTANQTATMPVLYAKISGVERGDVGAYWQKIRQLVDKDTFLVRRMPMIVPGSAINWQPLAVKYLRDGRLKRSALRQDRQYPFAIIREELQEHMLDKLQLMLDRRLVKGTFENGMEYTIVSTVLNMDKALVRLLQSFDFTQKNPKLVWVCSDERGVSVEDAILVAFLNLVGFDIALFVPTGYQTVERYLNDNLPVEHQTGDYLYDLTVPDINALPQPKGRSWLNNLFKRGN